LERQVEQALSLLAPGGVVELRALDVSTPSYRRQHTVLGYFDQDHLKEMAQEAVRLTGLPHPRLPTAKGVYFTLNPLKPSTLARRCNRVDVAGAGDGTSDEDVEVRRWLLIDADPERDAKISATDAEKECAGTTIQAVREHLTGLGWPAPILSDSGNGYHLLYRIDLPAKDGGIVERSLKALARLFDNDSAKIDTSVFNAARICKIPGTMARKGDSTKDRPHRRAKILEAPATVELVPGELLEALAATWTEPQAVPRNRRAGHADPFGPSPPTIATHGGDGEYTSRLLVEKWLTDQGREFSIKPTQASGGRLPLEGMPV
jgi:hypothetical protein